MKLLVIVLIIGSTDISVDCYDFKNGGLSYSTPITHLNSKYPEQTAQSAYDVRFRSPPSFAQQQTNSLPQVYQSQNQYSQPSQAFNVGYSVSFTNGVPGKPKQTFPDIVLGSHKEQVIKPSYAGYTQNQLPELEAKPSMISWQTVDGSGVEMLHSTNLDGPTTGEHSSNILNFEEASIPRSFDHAKALGASQGFDYTDVLGVNPILQFNQKYNPQVPNDLKSTQALNPILQFNQKYNQQVPDDLKSTQILNPILQFNQKYNQQVPDVLKSTQTLSYPPISSVPVSTGSHLKDNVVSLGNHPGTNIIISDNLEAKFIPEVKLQKPTDPNQEIVETFTSNPTSYEGLNSKFKLSLPNFPLPQYQSPTSDLTSSFSQHSSHYANREVQRPDFSYDFVPQSQNQLYKNYRTFETVYGQPYGYHPKNVNGGRIKNYNLKTKFARGIRASMQPPNHRTLPRRNIAHGNGANKIAGAKRVN